jgi:hypothetical protein
MLVMFLAGCTLFAIGCLLVACIAAVAMKRLGLELWHVLFWLGLSDDPVVVPPTVHARRVRLAVIDGAR